MYVGNVHRHESETNYLVIMHANDTHRHEKERRGKYLTKWHVNGIQKIRELTKEHMLMFTFWELKQLESDVQGYNFRLDF